MRRWMSDNALRDKIRNKYICRNLVITFIKDKIRRLRWFGRGQCRPINAPIKKSDMMIVNGGNED